MKLPELLAIILCILFFSCEKDSDILLNQNYNLIDTTIFINDTFEYSFGYFGDEEGISIISYPDNSKSCKLLNKQWEERILRYVPIDTFIGIDTVILKSMRGSDGASPSTDIDTIQVIIRIIKDDFHKKLIGKWDWVVSCGGFTGGCWYPDENNSKQIEFDNLMHFTEWNNDSIVRDCQYQLFDSSINGQSLIYKIEFDTYDTYIWFSDNKLEIQGGDFVEEYERIK